MKQAVKTRKTKSDYVDYEKAMYIGGQLLKDPKSEMIGMYVITACNTGLRCSDILPLTFEQLRADTIKLSEMKTGKTREIAVNKHIHNAIQHFEGKTGNVFVSQKGGIVTIQHINRLLKDVFKAESKKHNISSHSLRKSFGRRVYTNNNESEKALVYLMDLFNHSSLAVTKVYLGIRQEELNNVYLSL